MRRPIRCTCWVQIQSLNSFEVEGRKAEGEREREREQRGEQEVVKRLVAPFLPSVLCCLLLLYFAVFLEVFST